jgi:hypothetical protein
MKNNNLIRFAQSLVLLPALAVSLPLSSIQNLQVPQDALAKQVNIEANDVLTFNQVNASGADETSVQVSKDKVQTEADAIDAYFASRDMPLQGMGMTMVKEAYLNGLDWRLIPAIAVRESTGGKNACNKDKFNAFGWGSCKVSFKSYEDAIKTVAENLGGNNPSTARHYDNKSVEEILKAYNPPSVVPRYAAQVISIMNAIGDKDADTPTLTLASANS